MLQKIYLICLNYSVICALICLRITSIFGESEFVPISSVSLAESSVPDEMEINVQNAKSMQSNNAKATELRMLYSLLLQDRERMQWQPSRVQPISSQQQMPQKLTKFVPNQMYFAE